MRRFELFRPRSATRLSGPALARTVSRPFIGLARLSLLGACLLTLQSCLVDDPAPFPESKQTPPRLDYHDALPLLDQVIFTHTGEPLHFTIPVASEDAGDELVALLFLDYQGGSGGNKIGAKTFGASTLDDTTRVITLDWLVALASPGCHRITLRVTHSLNIDPLIYPGVHDSADLAEAYWWANIDSDPALGKTLTDCPLASRGTP